MADCTQKLQATISAAVESWQTGFNSLIVQHVRFFLGPTDVQLVAICLIWCRVVRSRDVRSRDFSAHVSLCYAATTEYTSNMAERSGFKTHFYDVTAHHVHTRQCSDYSDATFQKLHYL